MTLDIVIPTFRRPDGVRKLILSILSANKPDNLDVSIIVVDNNSGDATETVVRQLADSSVVPIQYILETTQGSSAARNAGIRAAKAELIGLLDDDEKIEANWLEVILEAFQDPNVDFIGGPCLPDWSIPAPSWLPPHYPAVIGWVDCGDSPIPYGADQNIILMSGNAVLRRKVFATAGYFSTSLGRSATRLLCGEDEELYHRILASGARGFYHPKLRILHWVPENRLTKSYYRRWAFWRAASQGLQDRMAPAPVPRIFGFPRWRLRHSVTALFKSLPLFSSSSESLRFEAQLDAISLPGFLLGRFVLRRKSDA